MDIKIICDNINDLQFNDKKNVELFKFIVNSKINYSKSNNKIFFDLNQLNENQLQNINNILIK
jgi:hypothetical protein